MCVVLSGSLTDRLDLEWVGPGYRYKCGKFDYKRGDTQEGREDRLGSSEGLKWVKHRELWGPGPGLGRSQLTRLGLGWSQLRRLNLSRSELRLALRSGLEPAVKLGKLRLLALELWGNSQLRSLLRPGSGCSAREGCEGSWPLSST